MQIRRAVALGALLVIVLLIALGVHSCDVSSTRSALQNYTSNVSSLMARSAQNGSSLFSALSHAGSAGNPTAVQNEVNQALSTANRLVADAHNMSVPGQVKTGHGYVELALRMRADGIANIANEIQPALASSAGTAEATKIAAQTARLYSSDVIYKDYAAPHIAGAVNAAGVRFSPLNRQQFVPSIQWVVPTYVAQQLHIKAPGTSSNTAGPGPHGHQLSSVSVDGNTLAQGGTDNTVSASPAPTFTLDFANTGASNESNVVCRVSVTGTGVSGHTTVPQTTAGKSATCQVKLNSSPPTGTPETVVATVEKVPGEKNLSNNTISYTITFQ